FTSLWNISPFVYTLEVDTGVHLLLPVHRVNFSVEPCFPNIVSALTVISLLSI
ncbi:hypothetical protein A2U01_0067294, partial [Trifolium medium]|nr:hypothetical protein [Trifolium medium]